ncbi:MAG: polysaccharide pyruvyl transferase family protein [Bacteroidales bacterium]|jgi:hypothetical protein|nr:polysaccharide pyruvyl transferase family protein [Bacteroidales bacterium]
MKIGILTQPFSNNYGGVLQNYALQTVLKRQGFEPVTINSYFKPKLPLRLMLTLLKRCFMKYILKKNIVVRVWPSRKEREIINQHFNRFVGKYICTTDSIHSKIKYEKLQKYSFDAFIVGSDQVWRPRFSPYLTNYFLDFLEGKHNIKKIAYATSFGVDKWEFTPQQTQKCLPLVKQFAAISVRETSAIALCRKYLDVDAVQVLDPTLLLKREDYLLLIEQENIPKKENLLFTYILNSNKETDRIIKDISSKLLLNIGSGMPPNFLHLKKSKKDLNDCIYPSILQWLAGFRDAKFVVTDSFHGTVFSIIFNKPFLVFANKNRGNTRFDSILKLFHLENNLITCDAIDSYLCKPDFTEVNTILKREQEKSLKFLTDALKN